MLKFRNQQPQTEEPAAPNTIIGVNSTLRGTLMVTGTLRIDGEFEGDILNCERIEVGEHGIMRADIEVKEALIMGCVYGNIRALEIATTLALEPEMMLLDEPTAGMTHEDVERITALIRKVAADRTVLMVEHNLSVVEHLSDRITVLQRGEILAEGDYRAVSANPEVIQAYLGAGHG